MLPYFQNAVLLWDYYPYSRHTKLNDPDTMSSNFEFDTSNCSEKYPLKMYDRKGTYLKNKSVYSHCLILLIVTQLILKN